MFNGIIFNKGRVSSSFKKRSNGINLFIKSSLKVSNKNLGISISCDGVCLTLISYKNKILEFYFFKSDKIILNRHRINISSIVKMINKNYKKKENKVSNY